jgi:hypothetical protein
MMPGEGSVSDYALVPDEVFYSAEDELGLLSQLRSRFQTRGDAEATAACYQMILGAARGRAEELEDERSRLVLPFDAEPALGAAWDRLSDSTRGRLKAASAILGIAENGGSYAALAIGVLIGSAFEAELQSKTRRLRANYNSGDRLLFRRSDRSRPVFDGRWCIWDLIELTKHALRGQPIRLFDEAHLVWRMRCQLVHASVEFPLQGLIKLVNSMIDVAGLRPGGKQEPSIWHLLSELHK